MERLKVFTTFSGYDSQCLALRYAGIPFDLVGWSEIDKYAIRAHDALFPEYADRNYGDITKIDWDSAPDFDFLTYSSPCQDISNAGLQRGLTAGSGTRSSLLWEVEKAIEAKRPRYLMMENVAALVSKKFIGDFGKWLETLESYGYTNYWAKLNAKDYDVPQNRPRVICISILGGKSAGPSEQKGGLENGKKGAFETGPGGGDFAFPQGPGLKRRLKDVLETDVAEKYFLSEANVQSMIEHCKRKQAEGCGFSVHFSDGSDIARTTTTKQGHRQTDTYVKIEDDGLY